MSESRKADKRRSTPAQKFDERKYYLVQFVQDNVKIIVTENELKEEDDMTVALYLDKNFYPCVVLAENEDKDVLLKIKHTMVKGTGTLQRNVGKQQKRKGNGKEAGQKEKKRSKTKSVTENQEMEKEKEQKKKEKEQKKRALDERDLNILSRMSQLNKSSDFKEREEELEKRLRAIERRQSELNAFQNETDSYIFIGEMVVPIPDPTEDIDVSETCDIIRSTPVRPARTTSSVSFESSRPTVAEKRPRAIFLQQKNNAQASCERCDDLLAQLEELKEVNKLLTEKLNTVEGRTGGQTPKPGRVSEAVAKMHNMVELSPNSGVYVYRHHLLKASAKKTESATALFLLSCFYSNADLIGKSLSGIGVKPKLDEHIICSILSYTMAKHNLSTDGPIKQAIRKKITSLESINKKKQHKL